MSLNELGPFYHQFGKKLSCMCRSKPINVTIPGKDPVKCFYRSYDKFISINAWNFDRSFGVKYRSSKKEFVFITTKNMNKIEFFSKLVNMFLWAKNIRAILWAKNKNKEKTTSSQNARIISLERGYTGLKRRTIYVLCWWLHLLKPNGYNKSKIIEKTCLLR